MKRIFLLVLLLPLISLAQQAKDYSVMLTATSSLFPVSPSPRITIKWPSQTSQGYTIYKKTLASSSFGSSMASLSGSDTMFVDSNVIEGEAYEYKVRSQRSSYWAYGYIYAGISLKERIYNGRLILIVDSSLADQLPNEISRLEDDIDSEGWSVLRHDVSPSNAVSDIKNLILTDFTQDQQNTNAVFIVGHVAVPYSGNLAPDGHSDHVGAWPCDAYYGELNGNWSDNFVNNTSASDVRNRNVPGDGKFDQTTLPSSLELQVGRIDFSNMPAFSLSEVELTKKYLDKNHAYRRKQFDPVHRAVIDDNFGGFSGEAFASSAWKSFGPMFGVDSVKTGDYFSETRSKSYLWSYGCGGGSYTSCSGVGNTNNFAADSLQSVFTALFGSYFGDWDKQNSFLRAPLAQGLTLTNAWSGRPHWHFHHMALGENIGYSFLMAANNGPYESNFAAGFVHIALMGDPTLRMHIIAPPSNLQLSDAFDNKVQLSWTASPDNVLGYLVFRKKNLADAYERLNMDPLPNTSFVDDGVDEPSEYFYNVRAVRLEDTYSGSYYNMSAGASGKITTQYSGFVDHSSEFQFDLFPNPNNGSFTIEFELESKEQFLLEFMSVDGRVIEQKTLRANRGMNRIGIDRSVPTGLYFVRISSQKYSSLKRVVIE